jgi:hypothetical protein
VARAKASQNTLFPPSPQELEEAARRLRAAHDDEAEADADYAEASERRKAARKELRRALDDWHELQRFQRPLTLPSADQETSP